MHSFCVYTYTRVCARARVRVEDAHTFLFASHGPARARTTLQLADNAMCHICRAIATISFP